MVGLALLEHAPPLPLWLDMVPQLHTKANRGLSSRVLVGTSCLESHTRFHHHMGTHEMNRGRFETYGQSLGHVTATGLWRPEDSGLCMPAVASQHMGYGAW